MSECILWQGTRDKDGYGVKKINGHRIRAHRLTWAQHNGPIPTGLWVLHRCDTPGCVNIDHLFLGTPKDNSRDMMLKGRRPKHLIPPHYRGEKNPAAKLTEEAVKHIRSVFRHGGMPRSRLAKIYGVHLGTIYEAAYGYKGNWKHVT